MHFYKPRDYCALVEHLKKNIYYTFDLECTNVGLLDFWKYNPPCPRMQNIVGQTAFAQRIDDIKEIR